MKKNASRLCLEAFFFIYYDQVLNNLYTYIICFIRIIDVTIDIAHKSFSVLTVLFKSILFL